MRSMRSELLRLGITAALPVTLLTIFPYEAINFRAVVTSPRQPTIAFVSLTEAEESDAINAARQAWRLDAKVSNFHDHLPLGMLPAFEVGVRPEEAAAPSKVEFPIVEASPSAWQPTSAAPKLPRLKTSAQSEAEPAFTRKSMLELKIP